jgi:hypothetical protein
MKQAIEVVLFRGKPGIDAGQMAAAAQQAEPAMARLPGFVSRSFGHAPDGRYVDIVHWQDMAAAQAAAEAVMQCGECAAFFSLIDEREVQMLHFERG